MGIATDLATLSLLEKKEQWEQFGYRLPEDSMLTIIPENNPEASLPLLEITRAIETWAERQLPKV